jgi:hypothetical protein
MISGKGLSRINGANADDNKNMPVHLSAMPYELWHHPKQKFIRKHIG